MELVDQESDPGGGERSLGIGDAAEPVSYYRHAFRGGGGHLVEPIQFLHRRLGGVTAHAVGAQQQLAAIARQALELRWRQIADHLVRGRHAHGEATTVALACRQVRHRRRLGRAAVIAHAVEDRVGRMPLLLVEAQQLAGDWLVTKASQIRPQPRVVAPGIDHSDQRRAIRTFPAAQ